MTPAKKGHFSTLKSESKLSKNDPRIYLNSWKLTGVHFLTLKDDRAGLFSMGSIFNLTPALGGSGRKSTTLVRDHEYFLPIKTHRTVLEKSKMWKV